VRPETGHAPVSVSSGPREAILPGRPTSVESDLRAVAFVEHVAAGAGLREAAVKAKVKPARALDLADAPDFWARVWALRPQNRTAA
jgi:hypothetical protein